MKKIKKFQISKAENDKKTIRNDSRMKGSEEVVAWRRKIREEGNSRSVQQEKVDDGVDVVVVEILGTKKNLRGAGVQKNLMTLCFVRTLPVLKKMKN